MASLCAFPIILLLVLHLAFPSLLLKRVLGFVHWRGFGQGSAHHRVMSIISPSCPQGFEQVGLCCVGCFAEPGAASTAHPRHVSRSLCLCLRLWVCLCSYVSVCFCVCVLVSVDTCRIVRAVSVVSVTDWLNPESFEIASTVV